jgi:DNA invertase Pin-like site-specific DNA recombinase
MDRLSRDMEDLAGIHKRLSFQGIEIQAAHDGTADSILIGIRGLVGQMQREDGAKKVRRGMAGVIRDGRHAGGGAPMDIERFPANPVSSKSSRMKLPSSDTFSRRMPQDERLGTSQTISTERTFVHPGAGDGTHRRSMAMPNVVLDSSSTSFMPAVSSGRRSGW